MSDPTFNQPGKAPTVPEGVTQLAEVAASRAHPESVRTAMWAEASRLNYPLAEFGRLVQEIENDPKRAKERLSDYLINDEADKLQLRELAKSLHEQRKLEQLASPEGVSELAEAFACSVYTTKTLHLIPEPEKLIDSYLNKGTLCRIFGPPKSLKSFAALDMAGCVGTGIRWFGYTVTQASVLYVVAEGAAGIARRVRAWEQSHGRSLTGVEWYSKAVQIGDPAQMRGLIAYAVTRGHGLIIFDTQARCTVGKEENSNSEMGVVIAALDVLREKTGACVMLVHHSGTEGGRGRGATAFDGAVDSEFEVKRETDRTRLVIKTRAQKDMAEAEDLKLETRKVGESLVLQLQGSMPPAAIEVTVTGKQATVLRTVAEYGEVGVAQTGIATALGLEKEERSRVGTHVNALLRKGLVRKVAGTARYEVTYEGQRQIDAVTAAGRDQVAADQGVQGSFDQP